MSSAEQPGITADMPCSGLGRTQSGEFLRGHFNRVLTNRVNNPCVCARSDTYETKRVKWGDRLFSEQPNPTDWEVPPNECLWTAGRFCPTCQV